MNNLQAIKSMRNLDELISITESEHESVRMAISALEKQLNNGWISCSERLPDKSGDYLCWEEYESGEFGIFVEEVDCDQICKAWNIDNNERIIAWQPLPESYKDVSNE